MSMEDIFDEKAAAQPAEPVIESVASAPEVVAPEAKVEPEQVKEPVKQEFTSRESAFLAKANDEKRKRQELEVRIAEMEANKQPPPAFWEDPDSAIKRIEDTNQQYAQRMEQMISNTRINFSETMARKTHTDFDEKMAVFFEMAKESPVVVKQMIDADDPGEFAYKLANNHSKLALAGNLDALLDQREKELRVKLEAEYNTKNEEKQRIMNSIPKSLSDVGSTGLNRPTWTGPDTLNDILGR